jgi:hypothetical protein
MAERKVDHSALRTNQAFIIGLLIVAFVLDAQWLVAFVAAVMLIGTFFPKIALFKAVYWYILKRQDRAARCASTIPNHIVARGRRRVSVGAMLAFIANVPMLGWAYRGSSWLAALNLFAASAWAVMYYWFNRLGCRVSNMRIKCE